MSIFSSVIALAGAMGALPLQVRILEKHIAEIGITSHPIETGAEVSDHAYIKPKFLELHAASAFAAAAYNVLVKVQEARQPITLVSGLYIYRDMMIERIEAERTKDNGNILSCKISLRQVIRVASAKVPSKARENRATSRAQSGGDGSTSAASPQAETTSGSAAQQSASVADVGDAARSTTQNQSILHGMLQ